MAGVVIAGVGGGWRGGNQRQDVVEATQTPVPVPEVKKKKN